MEYLNRDELVLVRTKTDPKTVQTLLRHANVKNNAAALHSQRVRRSDGSARAGAGSVFATAGKRRSELNHGWRLGGDRSVTTAKAKKRSGRHEETRTPDLYRVKVAL
jgi:hypothetical protein